jgi:hypothetical protein
MGNYCKLMRTKHNYTPNDFDISFKTSLVPSNIKIEKAAKLSERLQNNMPLSKVIHLNLLDYKPSEKRNRVQIHTTVLIDTGKEVKNIDLV